MSEAKTTWGIGEYPTMAERLQPVARRALEVASPRPGAGVLDVGCGTGTFGRLAAERGARVLGLDAEPALLEIARSLDRGGCRWRESDFAALAADDDAFEVVASLFGVMYAADHDAAARELARVCGPDGVVVLAAWTGPSLMPAFGRAVGGFLPPPPAASGPPSRWGDPEELAAILAAAGLRPRAVETAELRLDFDGAEQASSFLIRTAGHVVAERPRLAAAGEWEALARATEGVVGEYATSGGDGRLVLPLEYLLAVAEPAR